MQSLQADCKQCFGLCCVAPAFAASADFAIDKEAGQPCPHLQGQFRCDIHERLRERGFPGCAVYDCFGAGQRVAQETFGGRDWRQAPETAEQMFGAFRVMRQLHELLWYLTEALRLDRARPLHMELMAGLVETQRATGLGADALEEFDVAALRRDVNTLLVEVSDLARAGAASPLTDHRGADLIGAKLRAGDLRGANLRGAFLIRADLRGADLRLADVTGADLRGADLRGADLSDTLFLTQSQLDSARGDAKTKVPHLLGRPGHWLERASQSPA